ncbi:MAG: DUF2778 domain-containing protein [Hyphomicrobiales bacterium]|nr:DUF2778 domain-containing protein [Hyphomicrobiales bacterium]MBV8766421.1 DUF2778 domain-containing protein [Hyphomicrobiales bacterium]MBV9738804.1 DUF2778 domain-containing protein [Hyphomicrobiales bacterium]
MTYASDITTFDEFVVPWEQLRLLALAALGLGFTIVAAALVVSVISASCALFASLTSTTGPAASPSVRIGEKPNVLASAGAFPLQPRKPVASRMSIEGSAPETPAIAEPATPLNATPSLTTATPRNATLKVATTTPSAVLPAEAAPLRSITATLDAPLPPSGTGSRLVPLPPRRPMDTVATTTASAEAPAFSQPAQNKEAAHPLASDAKPRAGATPETVVTSAPAQDDRNPLQKLFSAFSQATSSAFAARTEGQGALAGLGGRTALYDIEAHTVYLPSGEKLEAHSGLGNRFDDPRYVSEKNRGATPPNVYDLELRRDLFHGVPALRMNPTGSGNMFGRNGILAHSYMLGPRGDSNGCVSFRDYPKFLRAFQSGEISKIAVVTHVGAPFSVASSHN